MPHPGDHFAPGSVPKFKKPHRFKAATCCGDKTADIVLIQIFTLYSPRP